MKVSDELKKAQEISYGEFCEYGIDTLSNAIKDAIPRIVALERCRDLLAKHQGNDHDTEGFNLCPECEWGADYYNPRISPFRGHLSDCEIAIALEATP